LTARLRLEPQSLRHFSEWFELERVRFENGHFDLTEDEAWLRLSARQGLWAMFGIGLFFMRDLETGTMIGEAGLQYRRRQLGSIFDDYPEAAWAVTTSYQGRGFASEAMRAVLCDYGRQMRYARFNSDVLRNRIVALIADTNVASLGVARSLGFSRFGRATYSNTAHGLYETVLPGRE